MAPSRRPEHIPDALKQQLAPGGVLLLPVGPTGGTQQFIRVTRDARDPALFTESALFAVRYVPLTTPAKRAYHSAYLALRPPQP